MKVLLAGVFVAALALTGCSEQQSEPAPQTSDMTIHVSDTAGIATQDVMVVASRRISDTQFEEINSAKTDSNGNANLTLPENATVMVGLWKEQPDIEAKYTWQVPFIVPVDNTTLSYSYQTFNSCPVVQPGPNPCPSPTVPEPSSSQ